MISNTSPLTVLPGRIYKHYKGGRYVVLHIVEESTNSWADTFGVVYLSLTYGKIYHRELAEFIDEVEWPDGVKRRRFILEE